MIILGFDSSTDACSAALLAHDKIFLRHRIAPQKHAELLLIMIQDLLTEADLNLADVQAIAFGQGPGSFMGVRIAAGIAQGLAYGIQCPVIPISSLHVLAQSAFDLYGTEKVLAAWDARMGEIYWGGYVVNASNCMENFIADSLSSPESIVVENSAFFVAVGNAWQVYRERLEQRMLENFSGTYPKLYPSASALLRIARDLFQNGKFMSCFEALPVYLRDKVAAIPKSQ